MNFAVFKLFGSCYIDGNDLGLSKLKDLTYLLKYGKKYEVVDCLDQRRAIYVGKISLGSISGVLWCLVVLTLYIGAKISDFIVAIVMGWGCFI